MRLYPSGGSKGGSGVAAGPKGFGAAASTRRSPIHWLIVCGAVLIMAIVLGTAIMVGLASMLSIPVGVLGGLYLAVYGAGRWAGWVRLAADVLVGAPSIAIGLFAYAVLVVPMHHFSAWSGAVALAVLMLPVVMRTAEGAEEELRLVFDEIAAIMRTETPGLFQDFARQDDGSWLPEHHKV